MSERISEEPIMTYTLCYLCNGTGRMILNPVTAESDEPEERECVCKPARVLPTGVTLGQIEFLRESFIKNQYAELKPKQGVKDV